MVQVRYQPATQNEPGHDQFINLLFRLEQVNTFGNLEFRMGTFNPKLLCQCRPATLRGFRDRREPSRRTAYCTVFQVLLQVHPYRSTRTTRTGWSLLVQRCVQRRVVRELGDSQGLQFKTWHPGENNKPSCLSLVLTCGAED